MKLIDFSIHTQIQLILSSYEAFFQEYKFLFILEMVIEMFA